MPLCSPRRPVTGTAWEDSVVLMCVWECASSNLKTHEPRRSHGLRLRRIDLARCYHGSVMPRRDLHPCPYRPLTLAEAHIII